MLIGNPSCRLNRASHVLKSGFFAVRARGRPKWPIKSPTVGRRPVAAEIVAVHGRGIRLSFNSGLRHTGLQSERVQLAAHLGLERLVDDLMLLHPRLAAEAFGDDSGGIVVSVA